MVFHLLKAWQYISGEFLNIAERCVFPLTMRGIARLCIGVKGVFIFSTSLRRSHIFTVVCSCFLT